MIDYLNRERTEILPTSRKQRLRKLWRTLRKSDLTGIKDIPITAAYTQGFRSYRRIPLPASPRGSMRSEIIFRASEAVENKYALCQTVSKAARRLHIGSRSMNETINKAFLRIALDAHVTTLLSGV